MKILSSFTHPQVIPNLHVFICSAVHKGSYLVLIKQISIPIDYTSMYFLEVNVMKWPML